LIKQRNPLYAVYVTEHAVSCRFVTYVHLELIITFKIALGLLIWRDIICGEYFRWKVTACSDFSSFRPK